MTTTWLSIPGSGGVYEASTDGRIRSVPRKVAHARSGHITLPGTVLKPVPQKSGHQQVTVRIDGLLRPRLVHHLVLMTFVGPMPEGLEGCHGNGDPTDNRLVNLRWGTRSSNVEDAVRHGTHHQTKKTRCPAGHELVDPNLVPSKKRLGHRKCWACALAEGRARYLRRTGHEVSREAQQAIADARFAELMGAPS